MAIEFKAIEVTETAGSKHVGIRIVGKLTAEDYEVFVPEIERLIEARGKIRILLELIDFHGWDAGAFWQDTKFAVKHFNDIERLAVVGDRKWEKGMTVFCKPFTLAAVRYFDRNKIGEAQQWIQEPRS